MLRTTLKTISNQHATCPNTFNFMSEREQSNLFQIILTVIQMIPTSDNKLPTHPKFFQKLKGAAPKSPSDH